MNTNWQLLLPKEWAGCVLHNLPICVNAQLDESNPKVARSFCDLSKSAADWDYFDFME